MPFNDYLNSLRYDQMFGQQQQPMQEAPPIGIDQMGMMPQMPQQPPSQPFQPEHSASDFLTQILHELPEHHKASLMDRIFAGITGLAGPQAAPIQDRILDGDYNQQMQDWTTKAGAATNAANMEKSNNTLAKSAYDSNESRKITQQRADEYVNRGRIEADRERSLAEDRQAKQDNEKHKTELLEFAKNNPKYTFQVGRDGMVYGLNPQNPGGQPIPTHLKADTLNDFEKHDLRMKEIEAQGQNAIDVKATPPGVTPSPGSTVVTTTSGTTSSGPVNTTRTQVTTPNSQPGAGKLMYGPQGQGPYMIPANKLAQAIKDGMVDKKPAGK